MRVRRFEKANLPQLAELVDVHLAAVVPGWTITGEFLAETMQRDHTEYITDPWVAERATLCAVEGHRVLAAVHLLRYGDGPETSDHYRGTGEIDWFLSLPRRNDAASATLSTARELMSEWGVRREHGWYASLPEVPMYGVPDTCPHLAAALYVAGYRPDPGRHREALYGGRLDGVPAPGEPPIGDLKVRRTVGNNGALFAAVLGAEELGLCETKQDLTHGGALPALRGWAELWEMTVREEWRDRGIGGWLLRHAVSWLRLSGCDRIVLNVTEDDEAAGAGRFYRRFGWEVFTREARPPNRETLP
jgi:GNAT superfamily N-acetyltransferase